MKEDQLQGLKSKLDTLIQQIRTQSVQESDQDRITSEGCASRSIDDQNRPMFDKGDAVLTYTKDILDQIGDAQRRPQSHFDRGHHRLATYRGMLDGYSNWNSATRNSRARAARGRHAATKFSRSAGSPNAIPFWNTIRKSVNAHQHRGAQHAGRAELLRDGQQTAAARPGRQPVAFRAAAASATP